MNKRIVKIIFSVSCLLILSLTGRGQSHFVYFQSEDNNPFYIRLSDSLVSSNADGYLLMHNMSGGSYAVIAGFPGKKIPEAAFRIKIGEAGNKGYLLKTISGNLKLEDIQSKRMIDPIKTAMSAGNRVRLTDKEKVDKKDLEDKLAVEEKKDEVSPPISKKENKKEKKEELTFSDMLNAVTGGATPQEKIEKTNTEPKEIPGKEEAKQTEEGLLATTENEENPEDIQGTDENSEKTAKKEKQRNILESKESITSEDASDEKTETENLAVNQEEQSTESREETKEKLGVFERLLQSQKDKKEEKPKAVMSDKEPSSFSPGKEREGDREESSTELTFLDFDNLHQPEKKETSIESDSTDEFMDDRRDLKADTVVSASKKKRKRLSFDDLLAKIDTTSQSKSKASIAEPLIDKNKNAVERSDCNDVADATYFKKFKRKVAGRNSETSMLRSANRFLSSGPCLTISQIREIAFLFISDSNRFQFLKTAYPHCAEQANYEELIHTLSSAKYQKKLKATIP